MLDGLESGTQNLEKDTMLEGKPSAAAVGWWGGRSGGHDAGGRNLNQQKFINEKVRNV